MIQCLVMLFHTCVFDPSNIYVNGEMSKQLSGDVQYHYYLETHVKSGDPLIGRLELGVLIPITHNFDLRYGVQHTSAINVADRGEERYLLGFNWRPFK